ncbi:hypothetical protein DM813_04300 [Pseudomonas alkylphenolica]|uniref:Uncharacterized protein n=1 Tax=Pseudomonas alkylphenolica TaxID=237609 RepID=A0A443ZVN2_9PSED|nr:hypothetical protein [Pseudomonas alkylphenolica]RWU24969.1 hypothetical protein DM813_04300 [Pseudomonas alkylphenolica]
MNYNEFTSYLEEKILAVRLFENRKALPMRPQRYFDAAHQAVLECRAFFDRFQLDEGPHNDHNPNSKVSVDAYRAAMYEQIAAAIGRRAAEVGCMQNQQFLESVLVNPVRYGETVSDQRFARVASEHLANIAFERTCAGCGAKYKVAVKAQTYRMVSNHHPETCAALRVAPVQAAPAQTAPVQAAPVQAAKPEVNVVEKPKDPLKRMFVDQNRPLIPEEMLKPAQKPAYNSPAYRANAKAALQLYAEFLKFYENNPFTADTPEENQRQMERMYNVVVRTVFNFDPNAGKNNQ